MLNGIHFKDDRHRALLDLGESAFPAYEEIIRHPRSKPQHVLRAILILTKMKADRRRFTDPVVRRLEDDDDGVRFYATMLLQQIGTDREAASVVPLLSDEDSSVVLQAACTLAAIGTQRELAAMDEWIKSGKGRNRDGDTMRQVKECRDRLEKRLKEIPKDLMN